MCGIPPIDELMRPEKEGNAGVFAHTLPQLYFLPTQEGKVMLRLRIVGSCGSIRKTARRLSTTRNTVRKWVRRYMWEGKEGLSDRSCRPKHSPTVPHRRLRSSC